MNKPRSPETTEISIKALERFPKCIFGSLLKEDKKLKETINEMISFCQEKSYRPLAIGKAVSIFLAMIETNHIERKFYSLTLWTSLHISFKYISRRINILPEICGHFMLPLRIVVSLEGSIMRTLDWNLETPTLIDSIQRTAALFDSLDPETIKSAEQCSLEFYKSSLLWDFSYLEASVTCLLYSIDPGYCHASRVPQSLDHVQIDFCFEALSKSINRS